MTTTAISEATVAAPISEPPVTPPPISATLLSRLAVRARNKLFTMAVRRSFASSGMVVPSAFRFASRASGPYPSAGRPLSAKAAGLRLDGGVIEIGDDCHFSGYTVISATRSIVIESHVIVARNVHILDHDHRFDPRTFRFVPRGGPMHSPYELGRARGLVPM